MTMKKHTKQAAILESWHKRLSSQRCDSFTRLSCIYANNSRKSEKAARLCLYLTCTITLAHAITAIICAL